MIHKIKSQEDDVIDKLNFRKRQEESKELEGSTEATFEQEESKISFNPEDFLDDFRQDTGKRYYSKVFRGETNLGNDCELRDKLCYTEERNHVEQVQRGSQEDRLLGSRD